MIATLWLLWGLTVAPLADQPATPPASTLSPAWGWAAGLVAAASGTALALEGLQSEHLPAAAACVAFGTVLWSLAAVAWDWALSAPPDPN